MHAVYLYPRLSYFSVPPSKPPSWIPLLLASVMPSYYLQDCHYFYRTALRGLNIETSVCPLYA